jgi:hypothetical protein
MNFVLLVTDPSGLGAMWDSLFNSAFQGQYVLWGLLLLIAFVYFTTVSKMRSGSVMVTGLGLIYFLSIFSPLFKFLFYLGVIVAVIVFIMGIKNKAR